MTRKRRCRQTLIALLENAEAAVVEGVDVYGACSISQVVYFSRGDIALEPGAFQERLAQPRISRTGIPLGEVKGQQHVERAVEVAAAGGHKILTIGPTPPEQSFDVCV